MDAPPDLPPVNPSEETHSRPVRDGETRVSDALESNMQPPLTAGQRFGDFKIRGLLGRGKAGFVYAADDLLAQRRCALKLLCRMSSHDLYRNKLGFRRMSPLRHPCLLRTDRIEMIEGHTVLLMEEVEGETLYATAVRFKELPPQEAYRRLHSLLHDYAVGLAVMHFAGLVHRDLKPTNLMVRDNGHGVIVDYGLVANCDPEIDPYGLRPYIAGTPRYFSPEALWEQSYTPAGDVFSLGLVMLDCLTEIVGSNQWLRRGEFDDWVRDEDERTIADAVSGMDESIPALLRSVIAGMLHADRTRRMSSAEIVEKTKTDENPIRLVTTHHLFGRQHELEQCDKWIREIYRGRTGRLHLYGDPGAGKTRLLDEIERRLKQNNWGQVFRVKCRSRENQTLQVIDQIADQIAQRYSRSDRDPLKLDPVSASVLIQSFPQLRHVIVEDLRETPEYFAAMPERLDALSAAARLSRELRKVGPMIIIIDDAQWSDIDSDAVWDELQKDTEGCLGIITSSRKPETNQSQPADVRIHIGPLPSDAAFAFLQTAATRCDANINSAGLEELVEVSRCNAFRLQELAEEFRPGGMLHRVETSSDASISNLGDVDRFWRARFDRLSDEAKSILAHIVTAGAPVSILQLAEISGLNDKVDVSISELVSQRLVTDDATGRECISVVHDKIADGLIENLDPEELCRSHLEWAALLSKQNRPRDFAARIAGHFYAAGRDGAALPFAIVAAENADRAYMKADAGEWNERVLSQVVGDARLKHLRDAARCFDEADLPEKAAHYYLVLTGEDVSEKDRLRFETRASELLVRCGKIAAARPLIDRLVSTFEIPVADTADRAPLRDRLRMAQLADRLLRLSDADLDSLNRPEGLSETRSRRKGIQGMWFCYGIRPSLGILDIRSALPMVIYAGKHALQSGTVHERILFGAMANVWLTLISGRQTQLADQGRHALNGLLARLKHCPAGRTVAAIQSGLASVNVMSMRWGDVPESVDACVANYLADVQPLRLEIAQTRWLRLWADWHLGRWEEMRALAIEMAQDAGRRQDTFQRVVATTGYSGNAFLFSDDKHQIEQFLGDGGLVETDTEEVEFADLFAWMRTVQCALYEGKFDRAARSVRQMRQSIRSSLIHRAPIVQVIVDYLTALTSLHLRQSIAATGTSAPASEGGASKTSASNPFLKESIARNAIRRLENQPFAFAKMLAALAAGIDYRLREKESEAAESFRVAAESASDLGLMPYQLAAEDGLMAIRRPGCDTDSLRQRMVNHQIVAPRNLERLYTVAPPDPCDD